MNQRAAAPRRMDSREARNVDGWSFVARVVLLFAAAWPAMSADGLAQSGGGASRNVAVVVEAGLHDGGQIADGLGRYLTDVAAQGFNPVLVTQFTTTDSPELLRGYLAEQYRTEGLCGAVLIGHLPVATVYTAGAGGISGEFHPCDLFYMDLDGSWTSSGQHGYLPDTHAAGDGDLGPEIWLGWLPTWGLQYLHPGRTEATLLNAYFAKNHAYRTGELSAPRIGLVYTDKDWSPTLRVAALAMAVEDGVTSIWNDPATPFNEANAADYEWRLAHERYEHVLLSAHSSSTSHAMSGSTTSGELLALSPENLFYHLFACSAARYVDYGCIGAEYVFGAGDGLVAVGPTKTGGMMSDTMTAYFGPLGQGATFGQAMLQWWNAAVDPGGHTEIEQAWYYGMTVLGDPLLVTQAYIPEPSSPVLFLATGAGVGLAMVVRRRAARRRAEPSSP